MDKRKIIASLLQLANELDDKFYFNDAELLTKTAEELIAFEEENKE